MNSFCAGPYELRWPEHARANPYDDRPHYHGIVFVDGSTTYDVCVNPTLGLRLIITRTDVFGVSRDLPFHLGTARFLPDWIEVTPW